MLAPGFYSRQDIRTPVKIALGVLVLTQLMNLVFVRLFAHAGLALSIGLASLVNAALLYRGLRKRKAYVPAPGWSGFWLRLLIAMAVMGAILYFGARLPGDWLELGTLARVLHLCWLVAAGAGAYFATLFALGFRLRDFSRRAAS